MRKIRWNIFKNHALKMSRGVTFEEVLAARFVDVVRHPLRENQFLFLFELNRYIYAIAVLVTEKEIFLKTLYPSRKFTREYLGGAYEKDKTD